MSELAVLQAVRLKGRVSRDDLGSDLVDGLVASGLLVDGSLLRLTPEGRTRLGELLAAERSSVDPTVIAAVYAEFRSVNTEFKALVTDWQLRHGQPNTHEDAEYDAAVLARLDSIHRQALPLVDAVAAELPRLAGYSEKLAAALDRVHAGETMWLSRPLIDSYHTVWFELHEELILAAGLTREAEDG
jgi:hypothetical protein